MTELLEAVGQHLQDNSHGVVGETIWLSAFQDAPDVCLCVYEYEGETPVMTMGGPPIQLERPRLQIVARAGRDDYPAARDLALAARATLAAVIDQTIGTAPNALHVLRLEPVGRIVQVGVDSDNRPKIGANFRVLL